MAPQGIAQSIKNQPRLRVALQSVRNLSKPPQPHNREGMLAAYFYRDSLDKTMVD
jgi:hypothetical protein